MTKMNAGQQARTTGYMAHAITQVKNSLQHELRALKREITEMEKALEADCLLHETISSGAGHLALYATTADKHAYACNILVRVASMAVDADTARTPSEVVEALLAEKEG